MKAFSSHIKLILSFIFLGCALFSENSLAADRPLSIQTMGHQGSVQFTSLDQTTVPISVIVVDPSDGSLVDAADSGSGSPPGWSIRFVKVPADFTCGVGGVTIEQTNEITPGRYQILVRPPTCAWYLTDNTTFQRHATEYHYVVSISIASGADQLRGTGLGSLIFNPGVAPPPVP